MTITATPIVKDGCLMVRGMVRGRVVLTGVPANAVISPASGGSAFLGTSTSPISHHVVGLGILDKIPMETQMLLLEVKEESVPSDETTSETNIGNTFYVLLLPTLDGPFRTSRQGTSSNELQLCIESGDPNFQTSQAFESVFVNSGDNPFELIKIPAHLDWFGWCTWDTFYTEVDPKGGGCAVYVSYKPGKHDFEILKKLVLHDGSILRASLLKIWNMNKLLGVVFVFNCQGAGSWPLKQAAKDVTISESTTKPLSGWVPSMLSFSRRLPVEIEARTVRFMHSIQVFDQTLHFAPIGLLEMYNSGGAVEALNCAVDVQGCSIKIKARGGGRFGAYSSAKPSCCKVDMKEVDQTPHIQPLTHSKWVRTFSPINLHPQSFVPISLTTTQSQTHQTIKLKLSCCFSSPLASSISLKKRTQSSPIVAFVAQTSGWAQQEEDNTVVVEEQEEEFSWGNPEIDGAEEGEEGTVELLETRGRAAAAKIRIRNRPRMRRFLLGICRMMWIVRSWLSFLSRRVLLRLQRLFTTGETDQSRGFGFVTMSTVAEAEKAVEMFHRYVFSEHGKVVDARVVYDRESGRSRGFGFVTMSTEAELNDAIANLDGQELGGRAIRVNVAEERPRRGFF
ncbi:chloroplast RNA-binding protein 31B [Actinidia rufa]|uniref:Chloroplast RNA-binding protein 31B n=1 Tax=Actinidia rufa TaxID=165716 RepID=A0A7J0GMG1_9ERIC|nr:chloroplast RNA-binding protein 31B [Actinidia rufa]